MMQPGDLHVRRKSGGVVMVLGPEQVQRLVPEQIPITTRIGEREDSRDADTPRGVLEPTTSRRRNRIVRAAVCQQPESTERKTRFRPDRIDAPV